MLFALSLLRNITLVYLESASIFPKIGMCFQ